MKKIKFKSFQTASIVFVVLGIIYTSIRFVAKSIISIDKVCHENKCFVVEIAKTDEERQKGLMHREKLGKKKGMIFIFEEEKKHSFWMKNTLIPLDIIRINKDFKIVDIQTAQPCYTQVCGNYTPSGNAKYVLEINAGVAQKKDIKVGDKLKFKLK